MLLRSTRHLAREQKRQAALISCTPAPTSFECCTGQGLSIVARCARTCERAAHDSLRSTRNTRFEETLCTLGGRVALFGL